MNGEPTGADLELLALALTEARAGAREGGVPIGSAFGIPSPDGAGVARLLGAGHNRRVQQGSVIRHGEMDALENAGRLPGATYREATMATTLSPCPMCSGAIVLYGIGRVVIGENTSFLGDEERLRAAGVELVVVDSTNCRELMQEFLERSPQLWNEDIGV